MLTKLIFAIGFLQLSVLIASAIVPARLKWKEEFRTLSRLHRQMYWVYGGYVVLAIVALGLSCILNAEELGAGSRLARSFCCFGAAFWGIRLALQWVLDVKPFLTPWPLRVGYHLLTLGFLSFTLVYLWGALHPT